jgi:hypothetical protein
MPRYSVMDVIVQFVEAVRSVDDYGEGLPEPLAARSSESSQPSRIASPARIPVRASRALAAGSTARRRRCHGLKGGAAGVNE